MITRRRYSIPVKNTGQQASPGFDVRVGRSEAPLRAPVRLAAEENWWTDWRSTTLVAALLLAIGTSLYFVNGKEIDYSTTQTPRPPPSAAASSGAPAPPPSSPRRTAAIRAGNSAQSGSGYSGTGAPPAGDADSFLAFSRTAKAGREGLARNSASSAGNAPSPAGAPSVLSSGDRKIVLPDKLSGECKVGGANIDDFLKGLGNCFSHRTGGGA